MTSLFLIESPGKIKKISSILGSDYTVMASVGSICDLPTDEMAIDIQEPSATTANYSFVPHFTVRKDRKALLAKMQTAIKTSKLVYLASDLDREGETIADTLRAKLGLHQYIRITFNEITPNAIKNALNNPKTIDANMVKAQRGRRVLDRLVGYLVSPLLGKRRSAGRVQSVVLRMIAERDNEVKRSLEDIQTILQVHADFSPSLNAVLKQPQPDCPSKPFLEKIFKQGGLTYQVTSVNFREEKRSPSAPFTTSTLQTEAWNRLHMDSEQTMRGSQELYQQGLITYMRTDSTAISEAAREMTADFIRKEYGTDFHCERAWGGSTNAHECIRPTDMFVQSESSLYQLIWMRTAASQMTPAQYNVQTISLTSNGVSFEAQNRQLIFPGFLLLKGHPPHDAANMNDIKVGDALHLEKIEASQHVCSGCVHFNSGSIVKSMEETGVGRPSTYASTLKNLMERKYIETANFPGTMVDLETLIFKTSTKKFSAKKRRASVASQKKCLIPTGTGLEVLKYMMDHFRDIMEIDLTARMETALDMVSEGLVDWQKVVHDFFILFYPTVVNLRKAPEASGFYGTDKFGCRYSLFEGKYGLAVRKDHPYGDHFVSSFSGVASAPTSLEEAVAASKNYRFLGMYKKQPIFLVLGPHGWYVRHGPKKRIGIKAIDESKVTLEGVKALLK